SWPDASRVHLGGYFLAEAAKHGINGVPKLVKNDGEADEEVPVHGGKSDQVIARELLDNKLPRRHTGGVDMLEVVEDTAYSEPETDSESEADSAPEADSRSDGGTLVDEDISPPEPEAPVRILDDDDGNSGKGIRKHSRLLTTPERRPIYHFQNRSELVRGIIDIVTVHEKLYNTAHILTRDMTVLNVGFDNQCPSNGMIFNLANAMHHPPDNDRKPSLIARPVNIFFISPELVVVADDAQRELHFRHDLEAVFWMIIFNCLAYDGPDVPVFPECQSPLWHRRFGNWRMSTAAEIADSKIANAILIPRHGAYTQLFTKYFEPLAPMVAELSALMFGANKEFLATISSSPFSHADMIKVLREWLPKIEAVPEPMPEPTPEPTPAPAPIHTRAAGRGRARGKGGVGSTAGEHRHRYSTRASTQPQPSVPVAGPSSKGKRQASTADRNAAKKRA
ncbi:hypothetical protein FA95DRAFT_1575944, partial [Auriscalpium vulgare]